MEAIKKLDRCKQKGRKRYIRETQYRKLLSHRQVHRKKRCMEKVCKHNRCQLYCCCLQCLEMGRKTVMIMSEPLRERDGVKKKHVERGQTSCHPFADLFVPLLQPLSLLPSVYTPPSKFGPLSLIHSRTGPGTHSVKNQINALSFSQFLLKIHRV